jgi:glycine cleavage system H protein
MNLPPELKYTASHEWARLEADGTVSVGITDHAQEQLGDIVFVEPPKPGRKVAAGESVGVVESVKAASDIYAPLAGEVVAANDDLGVSPERVNADAYGSWLYRLKPDNAADLGQLLDAAAYEKASAE